MSNPKRILVIRPDRIGDTVCATPLIRGLRQNYPDAFIGALLRPQVMPVLEQNPHLDVILGDDWEGLDKGREGFWRKRAELASYKFDTALILLPTERHVWMCFLAGIKTRISVGTRPYHILTFTKTVSRKKYIPLRHEADYCLDLGRALGMVHDDLSEEVFLSDAERRTAKEILLSSGIDFAKPLLSVHPESGKSAPNWPGGKYAEFCRSLLASNPDVQIMVNLTPHNQELRSLFSGIKSERMFLPENGGDLRKLIGIISHAGVVLSASTGPMHVAAGLKVPTLSLFCPLTACSPKLWGPKGNKAKIVLAPEEYCSNECHDDPHNCDFDAIGIKTLVNAANAMLGHP
jgi:ADP-heptose:LPS heptosyltransferase